MNRKLKSCVVEKNASEIMSGKVSTNVYLCKNPKLCENKIPNGRGLYFCRLSPLYDQLPCNRDG